MTSIVENWTNLVGEIDSIKKDEGGDYVSVQLKVIRTAPHRRFPQLLQIPADNKMKIMLHADAFQKLNLVAGDQMEGLVRAAPQGRNFFHPDQVKKL